jgi:hypothetical protein
MADIKTAGNATTRRPPDFPDSLEHLQQPVNQAVLVSLSPSVVSRQYPEATRFCKRCATHRKDVGGRFLEDALRRPFWVCAKCCSSYDARNPNPRKKLQGRTIGAQRSQA